MMNQPRVKRQTVRRNGKVYILVEKEEFERLTRSVGLPALPEPDARGNVPAVEYARASIAREIVRRRTAAGITQFQLAELAGVRPETVNRIENAKHTADTTTLAKIERALSLAGPGAGRAAPAAGRTGAPTRRRLRTAN
jgi:DNA-binding XRE family transcriptional regulator